MPKRRFAALIPAIVTALFLIVAAVGDPRKVGWFLYCSLLAWGLFQTMIMGGDLGTESISEERTNGTLGLLYLTGLRSWEIFLGQLAGGLLIALNRLIALLPCLLVPFLMRAVPWSGYLATIETLLCWAALCIALRIFSSAVFADATAAEMFSQAALVLLSAGFHILSAFNKLLTNMALPPAWLQFSPGNSIFILFKNLGSVYPTQVHFSNFITLLLALFLALAAGVILRRSWKDQVFGTRDNMWQSWMLALRARHRAKVRQQWLQSAPYAWLAARRLTAFKIPLLSLGIILVIWLGGLLAWQRYWLLPVNLWLFALLMAGAVRWAFHYSLARQITEDRTSGTLELILTTPLTPQEIFDDQEKLWSRHAKPLHYTIALIYCLFFVLGFPLRSNLLGIASYSCAWIAIFCLGPWLNRIGIWTTFWVCLNVGRPAYALKKFIWQGGGFASIGVQIVINADKLKKVPYGTWFEFAVFGGVTALLVLTALFARRVTSQDVRGKIVSDFREIAAEPLPEKSDPRLKDWNIHERFFKGEPEKIMV